MWCMFSGDFTPKSGVTLISYPNPGLYCVRIELARTMCSFSFLMPSLSCPISAGQWAALGCNLAGRQMCSLDNTHWWEKRMDYTPGHAHVSDSVSDAHTHTHLLFSARKRSATWCIVGPDEWQRLQRRGVMEEENSLTYCPLLNRKIVIEQFSIMQVTRHEAYESAFPALNRYCMSIVKNITILIWFYYRSPNSWTAEAFLLYANR